MSDTINAVVNKIAKFSAYIPIKLTFWVKRHPIKNKQKQKVITDCDKL